MQIIKGTQLLIFLFSTSLLCAQEMEIYVSDAGNFSNPPWQILKYDQKGQNPEVFTNTNLAWPQDILFLEDQDIVLITNLNSGRITKYDKSTGVYLGNFATGISGPTRMKIGPDGLLYVLQWSGDGLVLRYELDGTALGAFTSVKVDQSIGLDWDLDGNLYVSSYNGDNVRKFDRQGNDMGIFINRNLVGPTDIVFGVNDDLTILDYDGGSIKRFNRNGQYEDLVAVGLLNPEGIDYFEDGSYLVGNGGTSSVKLYDKNDNFIRDLIPSRSGGLIRPNAVRIRDLTSLSSKDIETVIDWIIPSIGDQFTFDTNRLATAKSIQLFSAQGQLIRDFDIKSTSWNANEMKAGMYLVLFEVEKGEKVVQKIIVKH